MQWFLAKVNAVVCLSVVCNVCALNSTGWNFRHWYLGHPLTCR